MKAIIFTFVMLLLPVASLAQSSARAQYRSSGPAQYRGFWIDTFNTALNNASDVAKVINDCKAARCNALFVQVRRRGDSWYRNSLEPMADRTAIEAGFDPLAELLRVGHANQIEIHAFVIIGAIWNGNPTGSAPRPPEDPNHVFNKHGFNQATGKLYEGRDNWLTRTLLPDDSSITFGGQRLGNDFWLDLGHPDAAQYTLDVLLHLVRNYDLDGLHLDRIRYPDFPGSLAGGTSSGYNQTSVERFIKRYGILTTALPAPTDARWQQWRRDQVTNFVRRVYLNAVALKPQIKVSAATIVYGGGPATTAGWVNTETYWRVFQDWRAWLEEGILDLNIPMNYKREHTASNVPLYDSWAEFIKNHQYERIALHGLGVYLNSLEGTLRQLRKAEATSTQGNKTAGVVFFSHANTNDAVTNNPLAVPLAKDTPRRPFAEFASALTTGKSVDGATLYENTSANPVPVFADAAPIPTLPWKANPTTGHLLGTLQSEQQTPLDHAEVTLTRIADGTWPTHGRTRVRTTTEGNGFFGAVGLAAGNYHVAVTPLESATSYTLPNVAVKIGAVSQTTVRLSAGAARNFASVSAASYTDSAVAPQAIVAGFGSGLATNTVAATTTPLPTELAGTRVAVRDSAGVTRAALLFFVSPNQINYLLPAEMTLGLATVTVTTDGTARAVGTLNVDRVAPAIFTANANGTGVPAAVALRVTSAGQQSFEPVVELDATQNRFVPRVLELGANDDIYLMLFGTGWRARSELANVQAQIGGLTSEVIFAGAQGNLSGLDQINLRIPRALAGRGLVEVRLTVDGRPTNAVQIRVR